MTRKSNSAEGGTDGTTVNTGNSGGVSGDAWDGVTIATSGGSLVFATASAIHGALGYTLVTSASSSSTYFSWSWSSPTEMFGTLYFNISTLTTSSIIQLVNHVLSATSGVRIRLSAAQKLAIVNRAGTTTATGTVVLSTGTTYRLEWHVVCSTTVGSITATVYLGDSSASLDSVSTSNTNTDTAIDATQVGVQGNASATVRMDTITLDTVTAPGAFVKGPRAPVVVSRAVARSSLW